MKHRWLALLPLTSCCVAQFLTGQGPVLVHGRGTETTILLPPIPLDSSGFFPMRAQSVHTYTFFFEFFSVMGYRRILNMVPRVIQ